MGLVVYDTLINNGYKLIVDMPIGSVPVSPNRESVSYAEGVEEKIRGAAELAKGKFTQEIQDKVDAAATPWEAFIIAAQFNRYIKIDKYKGEKFSKIVSGLNVSYISIRKRVSETITPLINEMPEFDDLYYIDDNPKYRNQRIKAAAKAGFGLFLFDPGFDFSRIGKSDFPLLSSVNYTPAKRSYKSAKTIGVSRVSGDDWVPLDKFPNEFEWYISCASGDRKHSLRVIRRRQANLGHLIKYKPKTFYWVAPSKLDKYKKQFPSLKDYFSYITDLESTTVKETFPNGLPSVSSIAKLNALAKFGNPEICNLRDRVNLAYSLRGHEKVDHDPVLDKFVQSNRILTIIGNRIEHLYKDEDIKYIKSLLCTQQ